LHIAQQMPLPLTVSCSSKSRLVLPSWFLPFWYLLTWVVPDKFQKSSKTTVCVCCSQLPSVLWCCWLGGRNGLQPVKNWVSGWGADLHMAQQMPLPLTISCSSKSRLVLPSWFCLTGTRSPGWSQTKAQKSCKTTTSSSSKCTVWLSMKSAS